MPLRTSATNVRVLADHGLISLKDTKPVRGAVAHYYYVCPPEMASDPWVRRTLGLASNG